MIYQILKNLLAKHYTDIDLQITIDKDPKPWSTGNGLMHLGLTMCMYKALGVLTSIDKLKFKTAVAMVQKKPGLYNRNQGRDYQNGHDDYIGISAGSVLSDHSFHREIASYGIRHFFFWNDDGKLKFQDFLGRHVFYMFFLYATYVPLYWFTVFKIKLLKPTSYKILLSYMIMETLAHMNPRVKPFRNSFVKSCGLKAECARYFGETHPLSTLAEHVEKTEL